MVTDTAFYRYSHYHSQTDMPEKLNYPAMAQVVTGLQAALGVLARQSTDAGRAGCPTGVRERQRYPIPALPFCHIELSAEKTRSYDPLTLR